MCLVHISPPYWSRVLCAFAPSHGCMHIQPDTAGRPCRGLWAISALSPARCKGDPGPTKATPVPRAVLRFCLLPGDGDVGHVACDGARLGDEHGVPGRVFIMPRLQYRDHPTEQDSQVSTTLERCGHGGSDDVRREDACPLLRR